MIRLNRPWRLASAGAVAVSIVLLLPAQSPGQESDWTPPRTPWGDPDIQGNFSNQSENGTPLERPAQFEGREMVDVSGEELERLKADAQQNTIERFAGPLHAPDGWWQPDLNMVDGSQAWLVVDPPDGRVPPMTPQAEARIAAEREARRASGRGPADAPRDRSLYDRCISRGLPGSMMPAIYGNSYQIFQAPGYVGIVYEMIHEARIIPLDGDPHVSGSIRSYMGDARGRWEGNTLVVETTNFHPDSAYRNANPETLRIIERFTPISDEKIRWTVTVDDPDTWTQPWTFTMPLTRDASVPMVYEYACHEGNRGLRNILSAARAQERAEAEAGQ
jgi:hypothetical protein